MDWQCGDWPYDNFFLQYLQYFLYMQLFVVHSRMKTSDSENTSVQSVAYRKPGAS